MVLVVGAARAGWNARAGNRPSLIAAARRRQRQRARARRPNSIERFPSNWTGAFRQFGRQGSPGAAQHVTPARYVISCRNAQQRQHLTPDQPRRLRIRCPPGPGCLPVPSLAPSPSHLLINNTTPPILPPHLPPTSIAITVPDHRRLHHRRRSAIPSPAAARAFIYLPDLPPTRDTRPS